jgi:uncharacterized membrane protein YsdA (DUF1294 family)
LIAQRVFRHKTVKASFQRMFWTTVVLNAAVLAGLASPIGHSALRWLGLAAG